MVIQTVRVCVYVCAGAIMWVKHYYFSKHQKMDEREEQEGEPRELAPHWPRSQETRGGGGVTLRNREAAGRMDF